MSKKGFQMLKVLEIIRKEFPNTPFTLKDVGIKYGEIERVSYEDIEQQIRRRLEALHKWGLIDGEKDGQNNNQWVFRLADASDENVSDQVIKTLLSELVRTMTMFVDEKPDALQATQDQLNQGVKLNEFLTVSGENEFPVIDDQVLNHIRLLHENFDDQRFTMVKEDKGLSYPLFVFQVRMLSQGFYIAGLKPNGEVGASLEWIQLDDLYEIKPGESFKMPEAQLDFIKTHLIVLSNQELAQLQE